MALVLLPAFLTCTCMFSGNADEEEEEEKEEEGCDEEEERCVSMVEWGEGAGEGGGEGGG